MKLSKLIVWVTFLSIFAMATHVAVDSDTWWHLKAGQWMVENGQIIREDPFSYTRQGAFWQYPGLWVQIFMYGAFKWFGPGGLNLWVSLMIAAIFWLIWNTTSGNLIIRSLVLILAAMASAIYWAARPYLITYLLGALFFYLLRRYRKGARKDIYLLLVLMVIWVNSHGGFLAAFLFVGPYFIEAGFGWLAAKRNEERDLAKLEIAQFKHLGLILVLLFAVSLINPQGINLWALPFTTVSRQAEQLFIAEWQSPDFHESTMLPFAFLLILSLVVAGGSGRKITISEGLLLGGFGLLSLISVRNIFFFVIVVPAVLSEHLNLLLKDWGKKLNYELKFNFEAEPPRLQKVLNAILVGVVAFVALIRVVSYLPAEVNWEEFEEVYPVSAVEYIKRQKPPGRMFNTYNFGGYLIWALPEYPVFVDGRADLHQDEIILTWYRVIQGSEEWGEVFEEWDVGFVLVEPSAPLVRNLKWAGWDQVYLDDVAVVFVKPGK